MGYLNVSGLDSCGFQLADRDLENMQGSWPSHKEKPSFCGAWQRTQASGLEGLGCSECVIMRASRWHDCQAATFLCNGEYLWDVLPIRRWLDRNGGQPVVSEFQGLGFRTLGFNRLVGLTAWPTSSENEPHSNPAQKSTSRSSARQLTTISKHPTATKAMSATDHDCTVLQHVHPCIPPQEGSQHSPTKTLVFAHTL